MKLSKVGRGIAFGDVSNAAVRNILTEISKFEQFTYITKQRLIEAEEFFDWKCPYTGREITNREDPAEEGFVLDHIVPQNRACCGLNVMGNLIFVDKKANAKKHFDSYQEFLYQSIADKSVASARIAKIEEFQKKYNYDPKMIKEQIQDLLEERYRLVREEQENMIETIRQIIRSES